MARKRDRQYDPLRPRFPSAAIHEITQMNGTVSAAQLNKVCTKNGIDLELVRAANVVALDHFGKGRPLDMPSTYPTEVAAPVAALRLDESTHTRAESVIAALFEQTIARLPHNAGTMREALLNKLEHAGLLTLERREAVDNGFKLADQVARFSRVPRLYAANPALPDSVFQDAQEMALAMANPRVALIKTAEAMNRLRTWERANERDKKEGQAILRIAEKLYQPMAVAVGWKAAADKIQDYIFEYRYPGERKKVVREVEEVMGEGFYSREKEIVSVGSGFIKTLLEASFRKARDRDSDAPEISIDVHGRAKHPASVYSKLRKKGYALKKMTDLLAFRVVLPGADKSDCYKALGVLQQVFQLKTEDFKDYIVDPTKPYESLHLVATVKDRINPNIGKTVPGELYGKVVEIQVRTQEMDHAAEVGVASHLAYKQHGAVLAGNSFLRKSVERIIDEAEIKTTSPVQVAGRLVPAASADPTLPAVGQALVPEFAIALPRLNTMERQIVFSGLAELFDEDERALASGARGSLHAKGSFKKQDPVATLQTPAELSHGTVVVRVTKSMHEGMNRASEGWSSLTEVQPSAFMERVETVRSALTALNAGKPMQALPPPKDIFVVREDGSPVRVPHGASLMDAAVAIDPQFVYVRKALINGVQVDFDSPSAKQVRITNGDELHIGRGAIDVSRPPDSAWLKKGVMKSGVAREAVQAMVSEAQRQSHRSKPPRGGSRPQQS